MFYGGFLSLASQLDMLLSPLHNTFGPASVIILLAICTVCVTKFMKRNFRTKRHKKLEEEFNYWLTIREEAMQCEDREKGKRMARNIDKAKLNKCYYDYFFEGLMLSFANTYLPILIVLSYVNRYYRPERLLELTGKDYVVMFGNASGEPVLIGSLFFYMCALLVTYLGWGTVQKYIERRRMRKIMQYHAVSAKAEKEKTPLTPLTN